VSLDSERGAIGTIELELLTLVRYLETLGRRSTLYDQVDRAGYLMLRTLERTGPVPTTALAAELGLDASTVTRQATVLVAGGFAERLPNPADGRSSHLAVTPAGEAITRYVENERRRVLQEMFTDWREAEKQELGRSLTRLNLALVQQVDKLDLEAAGNQRSTGAEPNRATR
jgi:DNA-binding MarR family transcriptional regulator